MKQGIRTVVYDRQLRLEAYRFQGFGPGLYREIFCHKGETHGA